MPANKTNSNSKALKCYNIREALNLEVIFTGNDGICLFKRGGKKTLIATWMVVRVVM